MTQITTVAVVGAGTIGLSWAALFAAYGLDVRITDPRPDLADLVATTIPELAPSLPDPLARIHVTDDLAEAVAGVDLVQENGPERVAFKRELFTQIASHAPAHAILASSSSGIVAGAIAADLPDDVASRLLIAHPFNPPHVVPLVEIVPSARTSEAVVTAATAFYAGLGRTPVREHKEVQGFVANRLQNAVLHEAFQLVANGVVDVPELDTIMKASLGERWATVGPFESFHLGGGPGGIRHMMEHLGAGMIERWRAEGRPAPTPDDVALLVAQTEAAYGTGPAAYRTRTQARDRAQLAVQAAVTEEQS